jgi:proton glutamate symport protein
LEAEKLMRNLLMVLVALGLGTKRHWHIFIAIFAGVLMGVWFPYNTIEPSFMHQAFEVIGQMFIRLVAMLAIPLIISSLLIGMHSLGDGRQLGKMGIKTVFFFGLTMIVASSIAAIIAYYVQPGNRLPENFEVVLGLLPIDPTNQTHLTSFKDIILNLVPQNPFEALARRDLTPIIIFTLIFGTAMAFIGDTARPFTSFFEAVFAATMRMVDWVMICAVPGIFALTFTTIAHSGIHIFSQMMPYIGAVVIALLIQLLLVYPIMLFVFARVNFMDLYRAISEAILVAFGTASSSATLPVTLACMERRAGVSNRIASFVIPAGVSMNMNGTTMFEVISVMFLAQLYDIPLTLTVVLTIVVLSIIASIGAAGVPAAGMITMSIILGGIGGFSAEQVVQGLSLLWALDRILDMCRTTINVVDDCVVATIIAASEGELNREMLSSGETWEDVV